MVENSSQLIKCASGCPEFILLTYDVTTVVIAMIGVIFNVINIIVLSRPVMTTSTDAYLLALSICDLIHVIFAELFILQKRMFKGRAVMIVPIIRGISDTSSNLTVWLTVTFAVERLIVILKPLMSHAICSQSKARKMILIVSFFVILQTFPEFFEMKLGFDDKCKRYKLVRTKVGDFLLICKYDLINQIIFVFIPLLILIFSNGYLISTILQATKNREILTRGQKSFGLKEGGSLLMSGTVPKVGLQQHGVKKANASSNKKPLFNEQQRITIMLIMIIMCFTILQSPSCYNSITSLVQSNSSQTNSDKKEKSLFKECGLFPRIANALIMLYADMNFVFYSLFSAKFHKTLKSIFIQPMINHYNKKKANQTGTAANFASTIARNFRKEPQGAKQNDASSSDKENYCKIIDLKDLRKSPLSRKSKRAGQRLAQSDTICDSLPTLSSNVSS